ncbi:MAG TPA: S8 family serine peptidase [Gemmatimonadaceae bacterium]|nr:S8 family serine peptidase [Gemmatimonadaceae bacterium]
MSSRRFSLDAPPFAGLTGRGVRVAVIDSGVHPANPHIGGVSVSGVRIGADAKIDNDIVDRIGHGTAVAAAIVEKAPGIDLVAVRVFDHTLATTGEVLARGVVWAAENGARIINLSLGTTNPARAATLGAAVDEAVAGGSIVVSARESGGVRWLPGSLPNVAGVMLDASCERHELVATIEGSPPTVWFAASGYPRPIPGVPVERNLSGISFAVANVTGFLARLLERNEGLRDVHDLARALVNPPTC